MNRSIDLGQPAITRREILRTGLALAGGVVFTQRYAFGAQAAEQPKTNATPATDMPPEIKSESLSKNLSLISGAGGNIAVLGGRDGTLVVDSGLEPVSMATASEIKRVAPGPIGVLVNTHFHFDHAGGNERLAQSGARIVAHENCRKRMTADHYNEFFDKTWPAPPAAALPVITLNSDTTLHLNGEEIRLIPVSPAHTDGDVFVRFEKANLIHTGDLFFNGFYPFIDTSAGGWIGGMLVAAKRILELTDAKTRIIPGHGPLATPKDLKSYIVFLDTVTERFTKLKAEGKNLDEAIAAAPTKEFDAKLGGGLFKPEQFVRFAYQGLLKR